MTILGIIALALLVCLVLGLPIALLARERGEGWAALAADASIYGYLVLMLMPTVYAWWGAVPLALFAAGWVVLIVLAVRRREVPARPVLSARDRWFWAGAAIVAVVTLIPRVDSVNFLPWLGDMGAYINWANQFARTGELSSSWPPLLPAYLGLNSAVFGFEHVASSLSVSGLVLAIAIARTLHRMEVNRWLVLAVSGLVAVHVHAIWYSSFPSSETLNAPLFVIWVVTAYTAMRSERPLGPVLLNVLAMTALGLLRGTGPLLLVPLVILAVCTIVVPDFRALRRSVWMLVAGNIVAAVLGFWYGITEIRRYYVETQLTNLLPDAVMSLVGGRLGLFDPTVTTAAVLIIVCGAAIAAAVVIARRPVVESRPTRVPGILGIIVAAVLAAGVLATAVGGTALWNITLRLGVVLMVVGIAAIVLGSRARDDAPRAAVVLMLGATIALFYALQTVRLGLLSDHSFFLYWDRYAVSEILPALFLLLGIGLELTRRRAAASERVRARVPAGMLTAPALLAIGAVVMAIVVLPQQQNLRLMLADSYMRGAYDLQVDLNEAVEQEQVPVVWAATSTATVPGFFFPNTWMAFARPMQISYGYEVLRVTGRDNFGRDEVVDRAAIDSSLACSLTGRILVYELQNGGPVLGERIDDEGVSIRLRETVSGSMSLLSQPPGAGWQKVDFTVGVWEVEALSASAAACVR
ncbi:hypothetical protein [Microcella frigidaquae]|uniref:Glycosyltransferase RgtA/B/C/D-like domain-containing protein n=1 Tax=Microcella frigidaquae TaxID=424758 RepID=A0A840XPM4_9MICO|nr:hypothetical protein [Microcella frigidaquae]MBB5618518.1 hypothetical protein [Microcella frigidaquae]NHN44583.1 hypothetical protein [Microcella frigidaquae]